MQSGSTPQVQDYFSDLELPSTTDMELQLQQYVQQGVLTPEQAKAALVDRSEMSNIQTDPMLEKAQMDALLGLQDISEGGMTAKDLATLNRIKNEEQASARGAREAIIQNANARGVGGSGLELMAQLQNAQDSATRASNRDLDVAGQASERALEALMQAGQLGGQMQNQQFNQKAQIAGANDAIAKFNAQNNQAINLANTNAKNAAQQFNIQNAQNTANANVDLKNQQQQYNKSLQQQQFENQLKKRQGQAGIASTNATNAGTDSQNRANAWNQTVGTAAGVGAAAYGRK